MQYIYFPLSVTVWRESRVLTCHILTLRYYHLLILQYGWLPIRLLFA